MRTRLIVGCGYIGFPVAKTWVERGDRVFAITRRPDFANELQESGIQPIVWDWYSPWNQSDRLLEIAGGALSTVLIAVSHAQVPGRPAERTHLDGLENLLAAMAPSSSLLLDASREDTLPSSAVGPAKWVYLSTTGVFGNGADGDWLDEQSEVAPMRPGSVAAWHGEQWIREHIESPNRLILRPSGIYGPSRVPNWRAIRDRQPLKMQPDTYVNLIHLTDLVNVIVAMSDRASQCDLYCVSDGDPPTRIDYYSYISKLGGYPEPIFAPELGSPNSRSESNKRISSARLKRELSSSFSFPTYREGLQSLLAELS
ncbi:NAD-dependent epimerase/dehydratase family protein [Pirellulaceae bacterium SH449]